MKKTFWLYYGNILVTGVRCLVNATPYEIIQHGLNLHDKAPFCSALYPERSPATIRSMICHAEIRS